MSFRDPWRTVCVQIQKTSKNSPNSSSVKSVRRIERKEVVADVASGTEAKTIVSLSGEDCGALLTQKSQ